MSIHPFKPPANWTLARFFTPLAIQAASQALSYPLVAMVASRGPGGPLNLAGLAQAGNVLGILPLIFILPGLAEFYFIRLQKLGVQELSLVRMTVLSLIFSPFSVAIRAQSEGLAAWLKKPITVLTGHAMFMGTIIATGYALLFLETPGQLIGPVGLTLGSLASSTTMRIMLDRGKASAIPVGQTTTSVGQIR